MLNKDEKLNAPQTKLAKPPFTHCFIVLLFSAMESNAVERNLSRPQSIIEVKYHFHCKGKLYSLLLFIFMIISCSQK